MEQVTGRIVKLFCKPCSDRRWFAGILTQQDGTSIRIAGVGRVVVRESDIVTFVGEKVDTQYGVQYQPIHGALIERVASKQDDVVRFLSSNLFPSIGTNTAKALYSLFRSYTLPMLMTEQGLQKAAAKCHLTDRQMAALRANLVSSDDTVSLCQAFPHLPVATAVRIAKSEDFDLDYFKAAVCSPRGYHILYSVYHIPLAQTDEIMLQDVGVGLTDRPRIEIILWSAILSFLSDRNASYVRLSDSEEWRMFFYSYFLRVKMSVPLPDTWDGVFFNENCLAVQLSQWPESQKLLFYISERRKSEHGGEEVGLYPRSLYQAECTIAERLVASFCRVPSPDGDPLDSRAFHRWLSKQSAALLQQYTEEQIQAVSAVYENQISFLIGGPGTGKTQTVALLYQSWQAVKQRDIVLLAPTGKAASRLSESVGADAMTVARFLTMNKGSRTPSYIDAQGTIQAIRDILFVVDEASMIGYEDAARLLFLIGSSHVLFVGDDNQLPPIDAGAFLQEALKSPFVCQTKLTRNFRSESLVLQDNLQKMMIPSCSVRDLNCRDASFQIIPAQESDDGISQAEQYILSSYLDKLQDGADYCDVMLIAPFASSKYRLSSQNLNLMIKNKINPERDITPVLGSDDGGTFFDAKGVWSGVMDANGIRLCIGDRVLNTKNSMDTIWMMFEDDALWDQEKVLGSGYGLLNGDTGTLVRVYQESSVTTLIIALDDTRSKSLKLAQPRPTRYACIYMKDGEKKTSDLVLGYAMTVHKAQGSEAPHVIVAMSESGYCACEARGRISHSMPFLTKNMLYTALTRARRTVQMIGSLRAMQSCLQTPYMLTNTHLNFAIQSQMASHALKF